MKLEIFTYQNDFFGNIVSAIVLVHTFMYLLRENTIFLTLLKNRMFPIFCEISTMIVLYSIVSASLDAYQKSLL